MYCVAGDGHTFIRLPNFMVWACEGEGKKKKWKGKRGVYREAGID